MAISTHLASSALNRLKRNTPAQIANQASQNEAAKSADTTDKIRTLNEGDYLQRNGDEFSELFKSSATTHQNVLKSRHRSTLEQQGFIDQKELPDRVSQLWGSAGEKKLDTLARDATFKLRHGGRSALNQALQKRNPLERLLLLSKMSALIDPQDTASRQDLELALKNLYTQHSDEIKTLERKATPFAKLTTTPPQESDLINLEAHRTTGDAVISAIKLAKGLLKKFDPQNFETALHQFNTSVLVELRKSNATRHTTRASVALTNSSAFMTVRKALFMAKELRERLAAKGLRTNATDAQLASALLEECEAGACEPSQMLGNLLGEQDGQTVMDNPHLLMDMQYTVNNTPLSWWPESLETSRFQLLEKISTHIEALNECTQPARAAQREQQLRAQSHEKSRAAA